MGISGAESLFRGIFYTCELDFYLKNPIRTFCRVISKDEHIFDFDFKYYCYESPKYSEVKDFCKIDLIRANKIVIESH